jgi:uracil-DNA glycosylase
MTKLKDELETYLTGWRGDLTPAWSAFFAGVEPDLTKVGGELETDPTTPIIPGRRTKPNDGAPLGAHVFRAFDGIDPAKVSVVVIGQDPYPRVSRATGRAFEDGGWTAWDGKVAVSLQRLMQSAVSLRHGRPDLAKAPSDWKRIQKAVAAGDFALEPLPAYFDRLQTKHGVLWVNAGWTLTRFVSGGGPDQKAHIACWAPVMKRLLTGLAERTNGRVVYVLLGGFARKLFDASGVEENARALERWGKMIDVVIHPHPNTVGPSGYLERGNPFERVNAALLAMNTAPIDW